MIVTFDSVARIDLRIGKSVEPLRSWRVDRSPQSELGEAVRSGLLLGPKKCGRVYVLSDELWSGPISLDKQIVDAVTDDQLEQTLALEAEHASGISAFESRLGYVRNKSIDGKPTWWVTQAELAQLDSTETLIPKWAGMVHGIASTATTLSRNGDQELTDTSTSEACSGLAKAWLTRYLSTDCDVPCIQMSTNTWIANHRTLISILSFVAALAISVTAYAITNRQLSDEKANLTQLLALEKQTQTKIDQREQRVRQVQEIAIQHQEAQRRHLERLDQIRKQELAFAATRKRPLQLLSALLSTADGSHWIQRIDLNDSRSVISGIAVDSISVTKLAEDLESELGSAEWTVWPSVMKVEAATRLVHFEMTIVPTATAAQRVAIGGARYAR